MHVKRKGIQVQRFRVQLSGLDTTELQRICHSDQFSCLFIVLIAGNRPFSILTPETCLTLNPEPLNLGTVILHFCNIYGDIFISVIKIFRHSFYIYLKLFNIFIMRGSWHSFCSICDGMNFSWYGRSRGGGGSETKKFNISLIREKCYKNP